MESKTRWVACFDILGFKKLVDDYAEKSNAPLIIEEAFVETLDVLRKLRKPFSRIPVRFIHFSDTFVLYSEDESNGSWLALQYVATTFFRYCLKMNIPLRGAISFGRFFVDKKKMIYFGKAFNDAYEIAEEQDWVGLRLTSSACDQLQNSGVNFRDFVNADIPIKAKIKRENVGKGWSCAFGSKLADVMSDLHSLRLRAPADCRRKYDNAICFLKSTKHV